MPPPTFSESVRLGNLNVVTQAVLGVIDHARKLGAVMLAEAVAGSPQKDRLLDLYQREELEASKLTVDYEAWAFGPP